MRLFRSELLTYASLSHAGVHPFIKNPGPSFFSEVTNILTRPCSSSALSKGLIKLAYWSLPIHRRRALQPALQDICWCANSCCNSSRSQGRCDVNRHSIRELQGFTREKLSLYRCISGFKLASANRCCRIAYTAIWETSSFYQLIFKEECGIDPLIKMLLTTFGPKPFVKVFIPSSLPILISPRIAFE